MKLQLLVAIAALGLVACERRDDKVIFHGDEAKQKASEAADKIGEGAEQAVDGAKKLGNETIDGAKKLGNEVKQSADDIEARPPTATGGGPGGDAGTK